MANALHDYTAFLPFVEIDGMDLSPWASTTIGAMKAGIFWAVAGGIQALLRQMTTSHQGPRGETGRPDPRQEPVVFLTGGDSSILSQALDRKIEVWPAMTLEGIRLAAAALP
jgi:pantothenate kinase type III